MEEKFGEGNPDRTILTLPLERRESLVKSQKSPENSPEKSPEPKLSEKMEKRMELVLNLLRENPAMSRAQMSHTMEITDSQIKTAINKLKERGVIHREGSDTSGQWIINE